MDITKLTERLRTRLAELEDVPTPKEGHIGWGSWTAYVDVLSKLNTPIQSILEIGFNAGHSAAMFCELFPNAKIISIDIASNLACLPAKELIDAWYPGQHTLLLEDSATALPKLYQHFTTAMNSGITLRKFDLIFIDGSHQPGHPQLDLYNCQFLTHNDSIVVVDDTYGDWTYHAEPTKALRAFISLDAYKEIGRWVSDDARFGFSYGTFGTQITSFDRILDKTFGILIGCYGPFPQYSLRAVRSVINQHRTYQIHVAATACCVETVLGLQQHFNSGEIDSLLLINQNINKDPMMRLLIERADTDYVVWMDDDSHFTSPEWSTILQHFLNTTEMDAAGHIHFINPDPLYKKFREARPWWKGDEHFLDPSHVNTTWFPTGGLFVAKTAYLREHNFPDRLMIKRMDDILMGDMVSQTHGKLVDFPHALLATLKISDGDRRGTGELISDWRID